MEPNKKELKVLQFGGGNFLRGFADWMIHRSNELANYNATVCVVQTKATTDSFKIQNGVFHVKQSGLNADEFKVDLEQINVVEKSILIAEQFSEFANLAKCNSIELIISNTTERGIEWQNEIFLDNKPAQTFPGKLTQFLHFRFLAEINKPLVILPCELIVNNGGELKNCVLRYASQWNLGNQFINWLQTHITFCNTLVDRIVTGKPTPISFKDFDGIDELYVETEWFHFWAIEGPDWINQKLPFTKANLNVIYTNDLTPYRERKIKLLNGAHTALAAAAYLAGIETVKEAVEHQVLGKYIRRILYDEILITFPKNEIHALEEYIEEVITRFRNPAIRHEVLSITLSSFTKFKTRLIPTIKKFYELRGYVPHRLAFSLAATLFLYRGLKSGKEIPLKDTPELIKKLKELWQAASYSSEGMIALVSLSFNEIDELRDLKQISALPEITGKYLYNIDQFGILQSLKELQDQEHFLFG